MKILFCIAGLPAGGAERQFIYLLQGFEKAGIDFRVHVFSRQDAVHYQEIHDLKSRVFFSEIPRGMRWRAPGIILRDMKILCREFQPDLLFGMLSKAGTAVKLLRMMKKTRALTVTTLRNDYQSLTLTEKLTSFLLNPWEDLVITNHLPSFERLKERYKNKLVYIPNGISPKQEAQSATEKHEFWKPGCLNMLSVGRLNTRFKKQDELLRALDYLRKNMPQILCRCLIIGEGKDRSLLEKMIQKHSLMESVKIIPPVKNLKPYYQKADVLIHNSVLEGCPNVVLEAMQEGTVVLGSQYVGSLGILQHLHNGLVAQSNSYLDLAKAIIDFYRSNEHDRKVIKGNAKSTVERLFSMNTMITAYIETFKTLISNRRNS